MERRFTVRSMKLSPYLQVMLLSIHSSRVHTLLNTSRVCTQVVLYPSTILECTHIYYWSIYPSTLLECTHTNYWSIYPCTYWSIHPSTLLECTRLKYWSIYLCTYWSIYPSTLLECTHINYWSIHLGRVMLAARPFPLFRLFLS